MRLSEVKKNLDSTGLLDDRQLFSYATCAGTLLGKSYQNLVGAAFSGNTLTLLQAKTDGTVSEVLLTVPLDGLGQFTQKHRFLYSYTELTYQDSTLRFYNYDKMVFLQGFSAQSGRNHT